MTAKGRGKPRPFLFSRPAGAARTFDKPAFSGHRQWVFALIATTPG